MATSKSHQLTMTPCSQIGNRQLEKNDHIRVVIVDKNLVVRFTRTEYQIFQYLLNGQAVADKTLLAEGLGYLRVDEKARYNLDKHIDNIRSKVRPVGLDVFRVLRFNGYMLGEYSDETECA